MSTDEIVSLLQNATLNYPHVYVTDINLIGELMTVCIDDDFSHFTGITRISIYCEHVYVICVINTEFRRMKHVVKRVESFNCKCLHQQTFAVT